MNTLFNVLQLYIIAYLKVINKVLEQGIKQMNV